MTNTLKRSYETDPQSIPQKRDIVNARSRAIDQAWRRESDYVRQGRGTRDWTPEQQDYLLSNRRVPNYAGHHMRSVGSGNTPEEQLKIAGDKNNIQFLDSSQKNNEHLAAHNGNFRNKTNGYYDCTTGITKSFGDQQPVAPKAYDLSNPIINNNKSSASSSDNVKSYDTATNAYRSQAPPVTATDTSKTSSTPNEDKPKGAVDTDKNNNFYDAKVPSNKDKDTDPFASNLDKQNNGMKM